MTAKKRLAYLDIARGISILLVVAGHVISNNYTDHILTKWIYSFHMPLFFILSGYFFSPGRDFKHTLCMAARHTLLPYGLIHALRISAAAVRLGFSAKLLKKYILPALYGSGSSSQMKYAFFPVKSVGMTWFLFALFWCRVFYSCLYRLSQQYHISLWLLVTSLAVFSIQLNDQVWLPFSLQPGLTAMFFYHAGSWMKKNSLLEEGTASLPSGILPLGILIWLLQIRYGGIGMHSNSYNGIGAFIAAIIGTYMIVQLSKRIETVPVAGAFFRWCGMNSMILYFGHSLESAFPSYMSSLKSMVTRFYPLPSPKGVLLLYLMRISVILSGSFVFAVCAKFLFRRKKQ